MKVGPCVWKVQSLEDAKHYFLRRIHEKEILETLSVSVTCRLLKPSVM